MGFVEFQLLAGSRPNFQDKFGKIPLHYAILRSNKIIVRMLLKGGSSVILHDNNTVSPLGLAYIVDNLMCFFIKDDSDINKIKAREVLNIMIDHVAKQENTSAIIYYTYHSQLKHFCEFGSKLLALRNKIKNEIREFHPFLPKFQPTLELHSLIPTKKIAFFDQNFNL